MLTEPSEPWRWSKSRRSGTNGNCVEVAMLPDVVLVRNSKDPNGPVLRFTRAEWEAFVGGVEDGDFHLPQ